MNKKQRAAHKISKAIQKRRYYPKSLADDMRLLADCYLDLYHQIQTQEKTSRTINARIRKILAAIDTKGAKK